MKYANKRYRYVNSLKDMQYIYKIVSSVTHLIKSNKEYKFEAGCPTLRNNTYIVDGDRYYKITTMYIIDEEDEEGNTVYKFIQNTNCNKYACTWIFDKTDCEQFHIHPSIVSKRSNNVYKPFNLVKDDICKDLFDRTKDGKIFQSAKPTTGFNPKFDKTEHNVVIYDLNSAYATVLSNKIIDTYRMKCNKIIEEGEVGFMLDADLTMITKVGQRADFVFPLIDSPYKDYVRKWYDIKRNSPKGSKEKDEAKQTLVITVGLWQNSNPFLRAYVVHSCNNIINTIRATYKDKICMWNTDAVYATEHIPLLDEFVGNDIGQFKVEYEGLFRQKGLNYQKVGEHKTSYRGVLKMLFSEDFNILTDNLPTYILPYKMNDKTLKIEKNKHYRSI